MSTLVVKNLPDELHERLKQLAKRNHRSVTKQVTQLIESAVSAESANRRPETVQVKGARAMTREELDAALYDKRYRHYQSLEELNAYMDELRADRDEIPQ